MSQKKQKFDLLHYIDWRGDLSFKTTPLNETDALIFCQLSYLNFDDLISFDFDDAISLSDVKEKFCKSTNFEERKNLGLAINPRTLDLLYSAANSCRFGNIKVCGYRSTYDSEKEEQFSSITFIIEENLIFTAFRGTDDTLIGWKEDFNMAFMEKIPAQEDASNYLNCAAKFFLKNLDFKFYIGGHSKGGNLAIYSAANLNEEFKKNLISIFNFDGPGFSTENLNSSEFSSIRKKIKSFYPQFSIVGMLFQHYDEFEVVKSDQKLVNQHDPFSWFTHATGFSTKDKLDSGSLNFHRTFNSWYEKLSMEKREQLVETLFTVLSSTNAKTNSEFASHWLENSGKIIKAILELDSQTRDSTFDMAKQFLHAAKIEHKHRHE